MTGNTLIDSEVPIARPGRWQDAITALQAGARLGLIGNPENRRIRDFQAALEALGQPCPPCLSYEQLLRDPEALGRFDVEVLRVDSPGENAAVARALIALGGGPADTALAFGEIGFLREFHRGFGTLLDWIEERRLPCLNSPGDIFVMFDKWASHERFAARGVARPAATLAPDNVSALLEQMRGAGCGRIFLKPLHGSSASGVCAIRWAPGRMRLTAPLRIESDGGRAMLVNSLDVRTYSTPASIEWILEQLLPQGMIRESWIPKVTLSNGAIDLRIMVIAGEARHWVARQSRHPMTNLHLGNRRAEEESVRAALGEEALGAAFRMAERAAACFPGSLYAGVDVLIDARHRPFVGEINAFGDLLPRLLHRGDSAYAAIARYCHATRCFV